MSYEYDVFISYKHTSMFGTWAESTFLPLFAEYLKEELARPTNVFFDRRGLLAAESFPLKLRHALATSRCMVALWTPSYFFDSPWCRAELTTMLMREIALGYPNVRRPRGLVAGVSLYDGDKFPAVARDRLPPKWDRYAFDGEGFKTTQEYIRFQQEMREWVPQIAEIVSSAPEWQESWFDDAEPTSDIIDRTLVRKARTFEAPVMR